MITTAPAPHLIDNRAFHRTLVLALLGVLGGILLGNHAIARHGNEAARIRRCLDEQGPLMQYQDRDRDACIWPGDITDLNDEQWDIVICFSVLPYLPAPGTTISWMKRHGKISLIEMQYKGDGPGKMLDDEQMRCWLLLVFDKVTPIGKTLVDYRNKWRTIWMCT